MVDVLFTDEHGYLDEKQRKLMEGVIQTGAEVEEITQGEVSITFVNNDEIQELNRTYRDKDQPTDVLSFPMEEGEDVFVVEDEPWMLGDIIISIPRAREQAEEYGHSFERELGFLVIHGFLHLIGYDHDTEEAEQEMFKRQEDILQKHGLIR